MPGSETIIPVVEETVLVDKTEVVTGRLRIQTVTDNVQEIVKTDLSASNVEVTRISVEREIDAFPEVRVEGDSPSFQSWRRGSLSRSDCS